MERCFIYLFINFIFLAKPSGLWDFSTPIRDWTLVMAMKPLSLNYWDVREFPRKEFWWRLGHKSGCTVCNTSTKLSTSGRNVNNVSCIFIYFLTEQWKHCANNHIWFYSMHSRKHALSHPLMSSEDLKRTTVGWEISPFSSTSSFSVVIAYLIQRSPTSKKECDKVLWMVPVFRMLLSSFCI